MKIIFEDYWKEYGYVKLRLFSKNIVLNLIGDFAKEAKQGNIIKVIKEL